MNRWKAIKEIQKYSSGLNELNYYFEEYTRQEHDIDEVKSVRFILPLGISVFFPMMGLAVSIGRQYGVDFDIVDLKELELEQKGEEWTPWHPFHKPVYTIKCTKESEIKSALRNLKKSRKHLNAHLEKVYKNLCLRPWTPF